MTKFNSLQNRLLFAFSGLSIVICLFFIKLSSLFIEAAEVNAYEAILDHEKAHMLEELAQGVPPQNRLEYTAFYAGKSAIPEQFKGLPALAGDGMFETPQGRHYLYTRFQFADVSYFLLMDVDGFAANENLNQHKKVFLYSVSISVMLLSLLSSWYLAKLLSQPIRSLTHDVEQRRKAELDSHSVTAAEQSSFFGLERDDEIGELASALSRSHQQVQSLLLRERNFTRDVSHELRTPITLIKNTLALRKESTLTAATAQTLEEASRELEQTVEVLLALARQENLHFSQQLVLPIVERTVLNIYQSYPNNNFDVYLKVATDFKVVGNPYLMTLLFQNLVNNGFYHGSSQSMTIATDNCQLIFENPINANANDSGYQGLGHGQYLVRRIVEEMKWKIDITSSNEKYRVVIDPKIPV